jgi:hypothetical protein
MGCKNAFADRPSPTGASPLALALAATLVSLAPSQTITALSALGSRRELAPHAAGVAFLASNLDNAPGAITNSVVAGAENKAVFAARMRALPISIVCALFAEGLMHYNASRQKACAPRCMLAGPRRDIPRYRSRRISQCSKNC